MIVTRVVLQDYGVYRGKNEFDFTCSDKKHIILIGGTNGAGKTTLFESIMLCLYGISAMGKRSTQKSYEKFLARKIHRYLKSATSADHASITVQFKFFHNGQEIEYCVERSWRKNDGGIDEQLNITKRASSKEKFGSLEAIEKSHWQSFIEDIIPKGIVKLFFFDGEKIVEIAKEGIEDMVIKESFKSLLGIEVVEQLYTDLQVNLTRNLTGNSKSLRQDYDKYKAEKDEIIQSTERLREKLAGKQTEMDSLQRDLNSMESKISKIGGKFVSGRDKSKAGLASKRLTRNAIQQRLADLCSGILPFSLIPTDLETLSEQLQADESTRRNKIGREMFHSRLKKINSQIKSSKFCKEAGISSKSRDKIISLLSDLLETKKMASDSLNPAFDFSPGQMSHIMGIIEQSNTIALNALKKDTEKIIEVNEEIVRLEASIASAPDDDEIGSLITKCGEMNSQKGTLQAEMDHIEATISSNASHRSHIDSKLRDIASSIYKNEKSKQHVEITQNVQTVLEEFIEKLKAKKIHLLEQYLLEAIGILLHKKNFIDSIRVDPNTFEVTLFRKNNDLFPKDLLSEGEKQMFAMAVLWALAKTSGRPLPFIIDTPLARLDEDHRNNIVEKFFPAASHQILIFSTDKEIEYDDYKKLRPYMMRSYAMEYLEDEGATLKHDGYFWNKAGEKVVAVQ